MINKKTVFVLGAGASFPYGYPTGAELRDTICNKLTGGYHNYLLRQNEKGHTQGGFDNEKNNKVKTFVEIFKNSSTRSIDLFLARNPSLAPIGKYIIAYNILKAEYNSNFRENINYTDQDWYSYLFHCITGDITSPDLFSEIANNEVLFITFNYDRSLEHFLYESLSNSFHSIDNDEIVTLVKKFPIIHMYGKVGLLDWEDSNEGFKYRSDLNEDLLEKCSKNIGTIYESNENSDISTAHELLEAAEQVFYLGFGYAQENMDLLKVPETVTWQTNIFGTGFQLCDKEINDVKEMITNRLQSDESTGFKNAKRVEIYNMDSLKMLRNYL